MINKGLKWAQWLVTKNPGIVAFICDVDSKRPLGGNSWYSRNSADPAQLAEWADMTPDCNFGAWLGNDHVVIDLDMKPGINGVEQFDKICKANGVDNWMTDLETLIVETPSGGYHVYLKTPWPCANRNKFENGIDVRGALGYVLIPGSQLGVFGEWSVVDEDATISECPEWLLDYMVSPGTKDPDREAPLVEWDLPENIEQALEWLKIASVAVMGDNGDDFTYWVSCSLRDYGISEEQAFLLMNDESDGESWNQRCEPPWDDASLQVKLKNSYNFAQNRPGTRAASLTKDRLQSSFPSGGYGLNTQKIAELFNPPKRTGPQLVVDNDDPNIPVGIIDDNEDRSAGAFFRPSLWYGYQEWMALDKVREYVVKDWLIAHGVTALLATRGTGKSTVALDLGCHIALDMPWHGIPIMEGWNVIYICGEDDEGMILNSRAWHEHHGKSPPNDRMRFASEIIKLTSQSEIDAKIIEMREWAGDSRCVIILDTWARAASGFNNNAQDEMDQVFENAEYMAAALKGPMIACFHPPKNAKFMTIRGSAVQEDLTSAIWNLEDTSGGLKLSVSRIKGKGRNSYRYFKFEKIFLEGTDYFDEKLEGIVAIVTGGAVEESATEKVDRTARLEEAWAAVVAGCCTFSMEGNKYNRNLAMNNKQISKMLSDILNDRGVEPEADEFDRRYLGPLRKEEATGLKGSSQSVEGAIQKYLLKPYNIGHVFTLAGGKTVEIIGTTGRPEFKVHEAEIGPHETDEEKGG